MRFVSGIMLVLMIAATPVSAQNIVEIFGRDQITQTAEGTIIHNFTEGMLLPGGVGAGTLFNGQDMVAWLYATGNFQTPQDGDKLPYIYPPYEFAPAQQPPSLTPRQQRAMRATRRPGGFARNRGGMQTPSGEQWKWTATKADTAGVFQPGGGAYLYTAYESPREEIVLLETTGGTRTFFNGYPREGDHYDFGYSLVPVKLKKGLNEIVYTPGRFGRVKSKLVRPSKPVVFSKRDMTLPDLILGAGPSWAAIRVINATERALKGMTVRASLDGESVDCQTDDVMPLTVRKVKFRLPAAGENGTSGRVSVLVELLDRSGKVIDSTSIEVRQVGPDVHHERTFISGIDGSVQYFSVAPALETGDPGPKALVLSVHGAGVEARNQARAYRSKDWVNIVAATNRRPYGFNWEDWGRIDGLEVLEEARRIFQPDNSRIYLTGHSMGGHGTWQLGTTYPDRFAAIAPAAGYPDIATYGSGRSDAMHSGHAAYEPFQRSANTGRTISLIQNLKQSGVYILHGDADRTVPPEQARLMRDVLGKFHTDFCYYEYPGGEHWFGDQSVDWPHIFEYFKWHSIPEPKNVRVIDFHTASPAVSASDYWVRVEQQQQPWGFSRVEASQERDTVFVDRVENVAMLVLDLPAMSWNSGVATIEIEGRHITAPVDSRAILALSDGGWGMTDRVDPKHKYSARYGGFKQVIGNRVVFVYATGGNRAENEWYMNKARFDAETFYYRGNGSIDVIPDTEYTAARYTDRNVVLYGNRDNNRAWASLMKGSPIQVRKGEITVGERTYRGDDLAAYFVWPHPGSDVAMVGVVAGTGNVGMWATSPNNYISGITGFPDIVIFRADILKEGLPAVEVAGFFDNDWSLTNSDVVTK